MRMWFNNRLLILARSIANPFSDTPGALDGEPRTLSVSPFGELFVKTAVGGGGAGGLTQGTPATIEATSNPGLGVVASASLPALGGVPFAHNVASSLSWSLGDTGITAFVTLVLRDGASGVGPILWQKVLGPLPANSSAEGDFSFPIGLGIPGSLNTAMTLEFLAAPAGTGRQSVSITGYGAV